VALLTIFSILVKPNKITKNELDELVVSVLKQLSRLIKDDGGINYGL